MFAPKILMHFKLSLISLLRNSFGMVMLAKIFRDKSVNVILMVSIEQQKKISKIKWEACNPTYADEKSRKITQKTM